MEKTIEFVQCLSSWETPQEDSMSLLLHCFSQCCSVPPRGRLVPLGDQRRWYLTFPCCWETFCGKFCSGVGCNKRVGDGKKIQKYCLRKMSVSYSCFCSKWQHRNSIISLPKDDDLGSHRQFCKRSLLRCEVVKAPKILFKQAGLFQWEVISSENSQSVLQKI